MLLVGKISDGTSKLAKVSAQKNRNWGGERLSQSSPPPMDMLTSCTMTIATSHFCLGMLVSPPLLPFSSRQRLDGPRDENRIKSKPG